MLWTCCRIFGHVSHGGGGQWGEVFSNGGRSKAWECGKVPLVDCFAPSVDRQAPACLVEVLYELWYGVHEVDVRCLVLDLSGRWSCDVGGDLRWVHGHCP